MSGGPMAHPGCIAEQQLIAEFLAAHGATMRAPARPGRPRKDGPRHPNGRLRWEPPADDKGHPLTLAHRTAQGIDARNPLASECLGILYLRGELADPGLDPDEAAEQGHHRYLAGMKYGRDHAAVWKSCPGRPNPSPPSHLGTFLPDDRHADDFDCDDDDLETNYARRARQLRSATARLLILGPYPIYVLDDVVVYLHRMRFMDENRLPAYLLTAEKATIAALRAALAALVQEYR